MNKHHNYCAEFKTEVAIEGIRERNTLQEIAAKYNVAPSLVSRWKDELLAGSKQVFEKSKDKKEDKVIANLESKEARLERTVGELTLHIDFLKRSSTSRIRFINTI